MREKKRKRRAPAIDRDQRGMSEMEKATAKKKKTNRQKNIDQHNNCQLKCTKKSFKKAENNEIQCKTTPWRSL